MQLDAIYESALRFLEPQSSEKTFEMIVSEMIRLVGASYGTIHLEENDVLQRKYASSQSLYSYTARRRGSAYGVFKRNKARILDIRESIKAHPQLRDKDLSSAMIVPLSYQSKPIGVISVYATGEKVFTKDELAVLQYFAPFATLAVKKAQAFEQITEALQTRDLFISMASHELKTPLTSVYAYLQLMHFKIQKGEAFDALWVERIMHEIEHLTKLVNELLQINQVRTGHLRYYKKNCSLSEIVDRAVKNFIYSNPRYSVRFYRNLAQDIVYADYDKLLQVLMNVLNNAAKFSPHDNQIGVSLLGKDQAVQIAIRDKGKGIAKKDLPNIFEGFYKGDNSQHEGMGLGLFLAKQIVEAHNGVITVRSKVDIGTTVKITLPQA